MQPRALQCSVSRACPPRLRLLIDAHRVRAHPPAWRAGTLSPALGNLTELRVLNLNINNLYGSLPFTLSSMTSLEQLLLGNNRLTGAAASAREVACVQSGKQAGTVPMLSLLTGLL